MKHLRWRSSALLLCALSLTAMLWACENDTSNVAPTTTQGDVLAAVSAHQVEFGSAIAVHNRHISEILATPDVAGTAVSADEKGMPVITIYTK